MKQQLRILVAEDSENDFELLERALRKGGQNPFMVRVQTAQSMSEALAGQAWDLVISDWAMPAFSAHQAYRILKEQGDDIPFIIVSGTVGEETAVEAMRFGAHDFMAKDKLARLVPAIERELREAQVRRERSTMQEQLLISDRMATIGILAAGLAHEINNPLAVMLANLGLAADHITELLRDRSEPTRLRAVSEGLSSSLEAAERLRDIVRGLKLFSRSDDVVRGAVDLRNVIESSLRLASNEIRHRARVVTDYGEVPRADASESRLGQVFLNLLINAAHAIPEGHADRNEIRISTFLRDSRVVVEIRDTGTGMSEEVIKKIFTPFFTTKPAGIGTGLGLSICQRIISTLGGEITVESTLGKGSAFRVHLPVSTATGDAKPSAPPPLPVVSRRGRVLVVDDEKMMGDVIRRILEREHDVVATTAARDALEMIRGGDRFDVILCDLMMPDITGMAFHDELSRLAPDQCERMIFLTGGAFTQTTREFLLRAKNLTIDKPFETRALTAVVRDRVNALAASG